MKMKRIQMRSVGSVPAWAADFTPWVWDFARPGPWRTEKRRCFNIKKAAFIQVQVIKTCLETIIIKNECQNWCKGWFTIKQMNVRVPSQTRQGYWAAIFDHLTPAQLQTLSSIQRCTYSGLPGPRAAGFNGDGAGAVSGGRVCFVAPGDWGWSFRGRGWFDSSWGLCDGEERTKE